MNEQDAFNRVWNHFIVEKHPRAVIGHAACRYRTSDGRRCAAGLLIADEHYTERLEGRKAGTEEVFSAIQASGYTGGRELLLDMQFAHDSLRCTDIEAFSAELRNVATTHNLTVPGDAE